MRLSDLTRNMRFIVLWIPANVFALLGTGVTTLAIFVLGGLTAGFIWRERAISSLEGIVFIVTLYALMGISMGLIYGSVQKALLRQHTDDPWRGWLIASMIGGAVGLNIAVLLMLRQLAQYIYWMVMPPPEALFGAGIVLATVPFACIGLAQTVVLWRMVHGAWTWTLANIVGGIVLFSLLSGGVLGMATTPLLSIAALTLVTAAPGIVTGFAMLWLLNYNRRIEG